MIRWGIVGCGDVTEVKSGPGFQNAADSSLVAVMRRSSEKAEDYARRHHVPRWYDDAEALVEDPEVDAVSIATPPSSHLELALLACKAGKPTVVEKPMALNHDECRSMVEAFQKAGVPLFVAYYRRALPRFLKVKALLDEGAVGRPLVITISFRHGPPAIDQDHLPWRFRPEISGGGLFVDLGSHTLDLLNFLLGPIQRVSGYATNHSRRYAVEDGVVLAFTHKNDVQGTGAWHFNSRSASDWVQIDGTRGMIGFPTFGDAPIVVETESGSDSYPIPHPPAIQQPFIQTIVDQLLGRGACRSTGESAARTSWVMDQVLRPYYEPG